MTKGMLNYYNGVTIFFCTLGSKLFSFSSKYYTKYLISIKVGLVNKISTLTEKTIVMPDVAMYL